MVLLQALVSRGNVSEVEVIDGEEDFNDVKKSYIKLEKLELQKLKTHPEQL